MRKPTVLRIIFILNGLMMFLPFIFYYIFTSRNVTIEGLEPVYMLYTGAAYIVSFILLVALILKKNILGVRIMLMINILIALPTKAYIGIVVAFVSIVLSFHGKVKVYFSN